MKNTLSALAIVVGISTLAGCCVNTHVRTISARQEFINDLKSKTVALVRVDRDGDVAPFCTGVWVGGDKIVTAEHCARLPAEKFVKSTLTGTETPDEIEALINKNEDGMEINFITYEEEAGVWRKPRAMHTSTVLKHDSLRDIAVLQVEEGDDLSHGTAVVASEKPEVSENVHVMGHVIGLYWTYTKCTVSAYRERDFKPFKNSKILGPWMQVSGEVYYGNSGGGGFNDKGELVGIASRLVPAPNESFFVHTSTIRSFLK